MSRGFQVVVEKMIFRVLKGFAKSGEKCSALRENKFQRKSFFVRNDIA